MGLIRIESAIQQGKIGGTTPMLAPPLDPDKAKLLDPLRDDDAASA